MWCGSGASLYLFREVLDLHGYLNQHNISKYHLSKISDPCSETFLDEIRLKIMEVQKMKKILIFLVCCLLFAIAGMVNDIKPCADIVREINEQAERLLGGAR